MTAAEPAACDNYDSPVIATALRILLPLVLLLLLLLLFLLLSHSEFVSAVASRGARAVPSEQPNLSCPAAAAVGERGDPPAADNCDSVVPAPVGFESSSLWEPSDTNRS